MINKRTLGWGVVWALLSCSVAVFLTFDTTCRERAAQRAEQRASLEREQARRLFHRPPVLVTPPSHPAPTAHLHGGPRPALHLDGSVKSHKALFDEQVDPLEGSRHQRVAAASKLAGDHGFYTPKWHMYREDAAQLFELFDELNALDAKRNGVQNAFGHHTIKLKRPSAPRSAENERQWEAWEQQQALKRRRERYTPPRAITLIEALEEVELASEQGKTRPDRVRASHPHYVEQYETYTTDELERRLGLR